MNRFSAQFFRAGVVVIATISTALLPISALAKSTLKIVKVESEEFPDDKAANAVDGNPATVWHTQWKDASPRHPHEIVIELAPPGRIQGFTYLPPQPPQSANGTIKDYEIYVGDDVNNFGVPLKAGTFAHSIEMKSVTFEPKECRFIKLRALSEINGAAWTSAAEIGIIDADDKQPAQNAELLEKSRRRADAALQRPELSAYRGWIKYLRFVAESTVERTGIATEQSRTNITRLADWLQRIEENPDVIDTLRGVQEWAYESPADDSGQPFRLNIPTDYDPARPPALSVCLHGNGGNHIEHAGWMTPHEGMFELAVLGRGRGLGYWGLGEDDVLQAIDYVERHWHIDTNRVHLSGASMGGHGVTAVAARHPHLFASVHIICGPIVGVQMNNLLTVPVYASHSEDDPLAPIVCTAGPLARLRELGGQVIFDQTNGFGHGVAGDQLGMQRASEWARRQVRPDSRTVRHLDFTALSGSAARCWWAEVLEWGPEPKPARFLLVAGADNTLHAELSNITRLRLRLAESPFDRTQPLRVSVSGAVPFEVPAGLPETLTITRGPKGWYPETQPELPKIRLHTPGGPMQLYAGSPLLIVYGTSGGTNACQMMRTAAEAASKSSSPGWAAEGGPSGNDGIPLHHNLYSRLQIKADHDVTDSDLQKYDLVLIGSAQQNSLVSRLASQLPVRWSGNKISCCDGLELTGTNRLVSLIYYNPLAPQRLLFWFASDDPMAYAIRSLTQQLVTDLAIFEFTDNKLVVARSFDSRWKWDAAAAASPLLPERLLASKDADLSGNKAILRASGADFVFSFINTNPAPIFELGTTRLGDLTTWMYNNPINLLEISGSELLEAERRRTAASEQREPTPLYPAFDPKVINPNRKYRIAVQNEETWFLINTFKVTKASLRITELQSSEIIERLLLSQE